MNIIRSLSLGESDPQKLKELCKGKLRKKMDQMAEALVGTLGEHEHQLLKMLLEELDFYRDKIQQLEQLIDVLVLLTLTESMTRLAVVLALVTVTVVSVLVESLYTFPKSRLFGATAKPAWTQDPETLTVSGAVDPKGVIKIFPVLVMVLVGI